MILHEHIEQAYQIIERAIELHNPVSIQVGFSGGTDSLVATHLVMSRYPNAEVFHINTGIGVEKTRQYVRDVCNENGWPLNEIRAQEDCGQFYEAMVLKHGFPGPRQHTVMYRNLKERGIRELKRRKANRGERILLITGIRNDESRVRAGYKNIIINRIDSQVWVNAIYWFKQELKSEYISRFNLPINPVSKVLGISGECLCGAFAGRSELDLVRIIEPETAHYIEQLEQKVWDSGHHWRWDQGPKKAQVLEKYGQLNAFAPLCVGCTKSEVNDEH